MHRRTLQTQYDEKIQQKAVKHQEDLIKQAKEKYAALQQAKKPILKSDGTCLFFVLLTPMQTWSSTPMTLTLTLRRSLPTLRSFRCRVRAATFCTICNDMPFHELTLT